MYRVKKILLFNILGQLKVNRILFDCGKDMAQKYNLHHWDNSKLKNFLIIGLCEFKNVVFLVFDNAIPVATFQIKIINKVLYFEKLATSPTVAGKGIGSYCINQIESIARNNGCLKVCMNVYSPNIHAIEFYKHRGYAVCGVTNTLKYSELKMEKVLF